MEKALYVLWEGFYFVSFVMDRSGISGPIWVYGPLRSFPRFFSHRPHGIKIGVLNAGCFFFFVFSGVWVMLFSIDGGLPFPPFGIAAGVSHGPAAISDIFEDLKKILTPPLRK